MADNPWLRQPGESKKSYDAFRVYRDLGKSRTLDAAYCVAREQPIGAKTAPGGWTMWSTNHGWVARVEAYDAHMESIAQAAREAETAKEAARWAKVRAEIREGELEARGILVERAKAMAKFPLQRQTTEVDTETGRQTVIIEPARWSASDVAKYFAEASKMGRLAAEMETDRQSVETRISNELDAILDQLERDLSPDAFADVLASLKKLQDRKP